MKDIDALNFGCGNEVDVQQLPPGHLFKALAKVVAAPELRVDRKDAIAFTPASTVAAPEFKVGRKDATADTLAKVVAAP